VNSPLSPNCNDLLRRKNLVNTGLSKFNNNIEKKDEPKPCGLLKLNKTFIEKPNKDNDLDINKNEDEEPIEPKKAKPAKRISFEFSKFNPKRDRLASEK